MYNFTNSVVASNVWRLKDLFVNIYFIRNPADNSWILVDTGIKTSARKIKRFAAELFGYISVPKYILITQGHYDHTGSLAILASEWNVPVYAHPKEIAQLNNPSEFKSPDPFSGGDLMTFLAFIFQNEPKDFSEHLKPLKGEMLPEMGDWQFIHTPGASAGHISLFREKDRVLLAGDACTTTRMESAWAVIKQSQILSGPPAYFNPDWENAEYSLRKLSALDPYVLATGHGTPLSGRKMRGDFLHLVKHFKSLAVPKERAISEGNPKPVHPTEFENIRGRNFAS